MERLEAAPTRNTDVIIRVITNLCKSPACGTDNAVLEGGNIMYGSLVQRGTNWVWKNWPKKLEVTVGWMNGKVGCIKALVLRCAGNFWPLFYRQNGRKGGKLSASSVSKRFRICSQRRLALSLQNAFFGASTVPTIEPADDMNCSIHWIKSMHFYDTKSLGIVFIIQFSYSSFGICNAKNCFHR